MTGYIYLGLTVLCTAWIMIGLRELKRWKLHLLQAIAANYVVASITGLIFSPDALFNVAEIPGALYLGIYLGLAFIGLFFLMGVVAQKVGVGYMTVVTKMSLVIPILFTYFYYDEELTWVKIIGIVLALAAVFLINYRPGNPIDLSGKEGKGGKWISLLLIVILFVGSGINDTMFKVFNVEYSDQLGKYDFPVIIFFLSGIIGVGLVTTQVIRGKMKFQKQALVGGLVLGIPNYFSIVFLAESLKHFDASQFFPANNVALLVVTGLVGVTVYKESLNVYNIIGFLLALVAVFLAL